MNILDAVKAGLSEILSHKLRSLLTMLGVVLGVMAVISMVSITEGARQETIQQFKSTGINIIQLKRINIKSSEGKKNIKYEDGLVIGDAKAIQIVFPNEIREVVPVRQVFAEIEQTGHPPTVKVFGTTPEFFTIRHYKLKSGRLLENDDIKHYKHVCILGSSVAEVLFAPDDPIGKKIKLSGHWYTVSGVLEEKGSQNLNIYIPITCSIFDFQIYSEEVKAVYDEGQTSKYKEFMLMRYYEKNPITEIIIETNDEENILEAAGLIKGLLLSRHRDTEDFEIVIPLELLRQKQRTQKIFNLILAAIAGISLIVGGIGIMNIMLATILQRRREIGIRRCVGATKRDILLQFLIECLVITVLGGLIGIFLGLLGANLISNYGHWKTVVNYKAILLSFFVAIAVGLSFGLWPAKAAAEVSPIEALRYE